MALRIYISDDHPLVRSGLRALIETNPEMSVVGEAADGAATVTAVESLRPDVLVLDMRMPELSGSEVVQRIRASCPDVRVLVLTAHDDAIDAQRLLASGASGFVLKRSANDELVRAIQTISEGKTYVDPSIAAEVLAAAPSAHLSERETTVLRMIAEGHTMKEIASKLAVSTRTLETYRARALEKLGLKTRADIVQYAVQRGWLKGG